MLVVVGIEQLVGRMNFNQTNAQAHDLLHVSKNIGRVARMQAAAGDQPARVGLDVLSDEIVHAGCEADNLRGDVVDEHGTINAAVVKVFQEGLGGATKLDNLVEV